MNNLGFVYDSMADFANAQRWYEAAPEEGDSAIRPDPIFVLILILKSPENHDRGRK
jgi:hypothetical protein